MESIVFVEILCTVVKDVEKQCPDPCVQGVAYCTPNGILRQGCSKLNALGPMVNGQPS